MPTIDELAREIEQFGKTLLAEEILEARAETLKKSSAASLKALEKALGHTVPDDVRAFLARGLASVTGSCDEPFGTLGFELVDAAMAKDLTRSLRDDARELEEDDPHRKVIEAGVVLTANEPHLVATADGVFHFTFRNPLLKVAPGFTAFLEHWLAAACFEGHAFKGIWAAAGKHVPRKIPPAKNTWLAAYRKQFPSYFKD